MTLEVYLNGALLDEIKLAPALLRHEGYLHKVMEELRKKHKETIKGSEQKLSFCLCGVPSSINSFTPLGNGRLS